jgi:hypothetical protein
MALRTEIYARIRARLTGSADFGTPRFEMESGATLAHTFEDGTANGQADTIFADQRTLAASASESLDLAGALTDPLGGAAVFAEVAAIEIRAAAGNTNNVVVGGAASNAFVGPFGAADNTIAVPPGGVLVLSHPGAGWPVTAGTGDLLQIANSGAGSPVTYDVVIIGRSA